jgi:cell division protein FtsQ
MWNKPHLLNAISDLLVLVGAAALLAVLAIWAVRVPSLPVTQVVFSHELEHTRRAEIEQVLPQALKGNFFSIRLNDVRASLEQLPWVRRATVRRVWPERIEVAIEEHRPVARWGESRGELVNTFGEVFPAALGEAELASLPVLFGPAGTAAEVLKRYSEFVGSFQAVGEKPVQVTLSSRLAWQLKLANGMVLNLGREQQKSPIGVRLERFVEVYPVAVRGREALPTVVDLRYPNGFALRVGAK